MVYDKELTKKEIALIEKFIDVTFRNKKQIVDEKALNKVLLPRYF